MSYPEGVKRNRRLSLNQSLFYPVACAQSAAVVAGLVLYVASVSGRSHRRVESGAAVPPARRLEARQCNYRTTEWAVWPSKPRFRFTNCKFAGSICDAFGDLTPGNAVQF